MKKSIKLIFALIFLTIVLNLTCVSAVLLSDQGTDVKLLSNSSLLLLGNLTIEIYDSATGGTLIFSQTFPDAIVNGSWNLMINPDLEYGKSYWKDYQINGENLNFNGNDRIKFQSPLGLINNASLFNFSLVNSCPAGSAIRLIYENGSVGCEQITGSFNITVLSAGGPYLYNDTNFIYFNDTLLNDTIDSRTNYVNGTGLELSGKIFTLLMTCADGQVLKWNSSNSIWYCSDINTTVDLTNYALKNQSETFAGNITTSETGFFGWLGSLVQRITKIFANDIDVSNDVVVGGNVNATGNVTASYFIGNGSQLTDLPSFSEQYNGIFNETEEIYIYNSTAFKIDFNETKLNNTIESVASIYNETGLIDSINSSKSGIGNCPSGFAVQNTTSGGVECVNITQIFSETDPFWTANYTDYNSSWSSTYNTTYDTYNSTGLIKDWNISGLIGDWWSIITNGTMASWEQVMNGTLLQASQWNATNTSYYLDSNPYSYYNTTTLPSINLTNVALTNQTNNFSANQNIVGNITIYNGSMIIYNETGIPVVNISQASAPYIKNWINFAGATSKTAIGSGAGGTGTGASNTMVGASAGSSLTTGGSNTAVGVSALALNTWHIQNTAVGGSALGRTDSNDNTGIGYLAGYYSTSGGGNTLVGSNAGYGVWSPGYSNYAGNSLFGYGAGQILYTGGYNTIMGYGAGNLLSTGSNNTLIGRNVQASSNSASNEVNINNLYMGNHLNKFALINATETNISGNLNIANNFTAVNGNFTGNLTGNMIYGGMYNFSDAGTNTSIVSTGVYYNITGLKCGEINGFTCNTTSGVLTAQYSGVYKIDFSVALDTRSVGGLYGGGIAKNFTNLETQERCYSRLYVTSNEPSNLLGTCFLRLAVGDTLNFMLDDEVNPVRDTYWQTVQFTAVRVGN